MNLSELPDLSDREFREFVSDHLNFDEGNDSVWVRLKAPDVISRTRGALVDMEGDLEGQLAIRQEDDPAWAKRTKWLRSLVRRRIAQVNTALGRHNVNGKMEAQQWQGVAVRLAQAIARHEARLSGQPNGVSEDDLRLWATLDNESHSDKGSIRQWLMNLVVPEKYR
jgi:hypothetical protein